MIGIDAPREVLTGGRVQGFLAAARVQWIVAYYGDRVLARILGVLPAELAADVTLARISGWCRFETVIALDAAIIEVCGRGGREMLRELGRYAAHASVGRAAGYDALHRFFRGTALRDALFQENARAIYEELGSAHGRLSIVASPCFSAAWCESMAGYLDQVIAIHDRADAQVTIAACRANGDEQCVFELRWREAVSD
jgi:predicted hydrocarbon binding protein